MLFPTTSKQFGVFFVRNPHLNQIHSTKLFSQGFSSQYFYYQTRRQFFSLGHLPDLITLAIFALAHVKKHFLILSIFFSVVLPTGFDFYSIFFVFLINYSLILQRKLFFLQSQCGMATIPRFPAQLALLNRTLFKLLQQLVQKKIRIHIEKYYQNKFIKKCTKYIYSQMSKKRGNLIDEIRARLGRMQLEKIRFIQQSPENQKLQKEENKVMHQLMEIQIEDCQDHLREEENDADIEGWRSNRICNLDQKLSNQRSKKRTFRNITNINCQSNYQKLHNPIPYLKDVLKRLQSPKPRREFKTETQTAGSQRKRDEKNKTQQSLFYTPQLGKERFKILSEKSKNRTISVLKKPERAKFQSLDKNGENKPFPSTKPAKNISEYRKIKRKNSSQYEMDMAQEKFFLQQLMQGKRKSREHEDREKSQSHQRKISLNEKFTLKNLIY